MNKKKVLLFVLVALLVGLTGCISEGMNGNEYQNEPKTVHDNVIRFVDEEAGVVCYLYRGPQQGGLSCIPFSEVNREILQ